jgi:hypothetical protein
MTREIDPWPLDIDALRKQLQLIQARLGTPLELPADLADARLIAHELNNYLTREMLLDDLLKAELMDQKRPANQGGPLL